LNGCAAVRLGGRISKGTGDAMVQSADEEETKKSNKVNQQQRKGKNQNTVTEPVDTTKKQTKTSPKTSVETGSAADEKPLSAKPSSSSRTTTPPPSATPLQPTPKVGSEPPLRTAQVTEPFENLRERPQGKIIGKVDKGTSLIILEETEKWLRVRLEDGTEASIWKASTSAGSKISSPKTPVSTSKPTNPAPAMTKSPL